MKEGLQNAGDLRLPACGRDASLYLVLCCSWSKPECPVSTNMLEHNPAEGHGISLFD